MRTLLVFTVWLWCVPGVVSAQDAPAPARLSDLVAALEHANPEVAAAQHEVQMRAARIGPAGTLPDPVISVGFMSGFASVPLFPSASNPNAWREFAIAQELPYPGKLALRSRIAATDAEVARFDADDVRIERVAEFKSKYIEYRFLDRSLAIIRRNRERLQQMTRITEARFIVGEGSQQDVVKAQLELSLLIERETAIDREQTAIRAELNALLNRRPEAPIDPALAFDVGPLPADTAELERLAEAAYPALRRDAQAIERDQHAVALAKKETHPDFAAKVSFQKYAAGMPWMYGVEVMMNVPVFAGRKQRPMIAEATSALAVRERMRDATRAAALGRIGSQFAVVTASRRLVQLYQDTVLPQARLALEASLASYETGGVDFLTLLTNFTTILNYELGLEEQQAAVYRALAGLEPLVGQTFLL